MSSISKIILISISILLSFFIIKDLFRIRTLANEKNSMDSYVNSVLIEAYGEFEQLTEKLQNFYLSYPDYDEIRGIDTIMPMKNGLSMNIENFLNDGTDPTILGRIFKENYYFTIQDSSDWKKLNAQTRELINMRKVNYIKKSYHRFGFGIACWGGGFLVESVQDSGYLCFGPLSETADYDTRDLFINGNQYDPFKALDRSLLLSDTLDITIKFYENYLEYIDTTIYHTIYVKEKDTWTEVKNEVFKPGTLATH